jgi:hypothetical protein
VSENLAVKTDNPGDWDKKKDRSIRDLKPRPLDEGLKSTWAHCEEALVQITREIIDDPQRATRELQALALFILDQRNPGAARRDKILGVSIRREAISHEMIIEDANDHPIEAYSVTHRSLRLAEEEERRRILGDIFSNDAFETWRFSRDSMADLLESLLEGGFIAPAFLNDARSLLLEWQS